MSTLHPTQEQIDAGLRLATGQRHTVILPPRLVRLRLTGILFETDKTFLLPSAMPGIQRLREIYHRRSAKSVLVTGHADRAGTEQHNLDLSVERAKAVASFLVDAVDEWLPWYEDGHTGKRWGIREDQYMLSAVHDESGAPYRAGPVTGWNDGATQKAAERFRADSGLPKGGIDTPMRRKLIERYMATDGTSLPAGTPMAIHGCGEFHPSVATPDSVALQDNRRVEIFFFRGPIKPTPTDPCPAGGCSQYDEWVKGSKETIDVDSAAQTTISVVNELGLPARNMKVHYRLEDGTEDDAVTDDHGILRIWEDPGSSVELTIEDVQEGGVGDSLTTPSGQHFGAGEDGPR